MASHVIESLVAESTASNLILPAAVSTSFSSNDDGETVIT